jgi:hypothetical protein
VKDSPSISTHGELPAADEEWFSRRVGERPVRVNDRRTRDYLTPIVNVRLMTNGSAAW